MVEDPADAQPVILGFINIWDLAFRNAQVELQLMFWQETAVATKAAFSVLILQYVFHVLILLILFIMAIVSKDVPNIHTCFKGFVIHVQQVVKIVRSILVYPALAIINFMTITVIQIVISFPNSMIPIKMELLVFFALMAVIDALMLFAHLAWLSILLPIINALKLVYLQIPATLYQMFLYRCQAC